MPFPARRLVLLFSLLSTSALWSLDRLVFPGGQIQTGTVAKQNLDEILWVASGTPGITNRILKDDILRIELDFDRDKFLLRAEKATNDLEKQKFLEKSIEKFPEASVSREKLAFLHVKYERTADYQKLRAGRNEPTYQFLDLWIAAKTNHSPALLENLGKIPTITFAPDLRLAYDLLETRLLAENGQVERAAEHLKLLRDVSSEGAGQKWAELVPQLSLREFEDKLSLARKRRSSLSLFQAATLDIQGKSPEKKPVPPETFPVTTNAWFQFKFAKDLYFPIETR